MNIYQKLVEVRKVVPYLQQVNQGHQYKYVGSSQVLAAVRAKMDELNLLLVPRVTGHVLHGDMVVSTDKYSNEKHTTTYMTELDMTFTWVNAENPDETIECPWYGQGIDTAGEKGVGKALTYAEKYFMLKFFNIATDKDDPDSFQNKHEQSGQTSNPAQHDRLKNKMGGNQGNQQFPKPNPQTPPEDIAKTWNELYKDDPKTLPHLQYWYNKKRGEGKSNEEIEYGLANLLAEKTEKEGVTA